MRLYEVRIMEARRFAGSSADAARLKREMLEIVGLGPRAPVATVEQVEVPVTKQGLITFLNGLGAPLRVPTPEPPRSTNDAEG